MFLIPTPAKLLNLKTLLHYIDRRLYTGVDLPVLNENIFEQSELIFV